MFNFPKYLKIVWLPIFPSFLPKKTMSKDIELRKIAGSNPILTGSQLGPRPICCEAGARKGRFGKPPSSQPGATQWYTVDDLLRMSP